MPRSARGLAQPDETLEAEGVEYAIRLPVNRVLQARIGHLLTRPVGRPPKRPQVFCTSFAHQAMPHRVVAKVEWHQGKLYPRVGFVVTNLRHPAERVVKFYNGRGTAEQWIREAKAALRSARLSCRAFRANAVRLQLFALAYNLADFLRSLALLDEAAQWALTTLRERLVKIGARIVRHSRSIVFQLAEVAVPRPRCSRRSSSASSGYTGHPCRRRDAAERGGSGSRGGNYASSDGKRHRGGPNPLMARDLLVLSTRRLLRHGADHAPALAYHTGGALVD